MRPASARVVDPEDDLASATYGAAYGATHDAETTRIAPFGDPGHAPVPPPVEPGAAPSTGYGLLHDPEPLPYVQPSRPDISAHFGAPPPLQPGPMEIAPSDAELKAVGRRGTQDLGLFLLRVALGVVFIAHGLQKAFGWWGGSGLDGFKTTLSDAGYEHADVLTYVGAGAQIAAGVLLVLGLFTPLAAAGALAFLVNSVLVSFDNQRREGGLFILGSVGAEYLLMLSVVAAVIILAGPGRYGFDGGRGWARRPFIGSLAALLLGIGGGVAAWLFRHGNNPFV